MKWALITWMPRFQGAKSGRVKATLVRLWSAASRKSLTVVKPLFDILGKKYHPGGRQWGWGKPVRWLTKLLLALNIEAVSEALVFASKAGADPVRVRQALMGGFASSRILEVHGERMINRTFEPGFKIALHQKDLNLALQSAKALALNLPNTATCPGIIQYLCGKWREPA